MIKFFVCLYCFLTTRFFLSYFFTFSYLLQIYAMLIISLSLSMYADFLSTLLYNRRAAETLFGTFTVNIYCKLFLKTSLLIFSDHLFYQYRGTLLIARKELKHLPTWGIGIVDGWPLTWLPSWEKRAETLRQGTVKKSRQHTK